MSNTLTLIQQLIATLEISTQVDSSTHIWSINEPYYGTTNPISVIPTDLGKLGDYVINQFDGAMYLKTSTGWTFFLQLAPDTMDAINIIFDNTDTGLTSTNVQAALSELAGLVSGLDTRVGQAESDISGLDTRVGQAESDIGGLSGRLDTAESDIGTLDSAVYAIQQTLPLKADLVDGLVPASQLPAYVDDVYTYPTRTDFPLEGEDGKIYIAKDTNLQYRWDGIDDYAVISPSLALGETSSTAFRGDYGKTAYDHALTSGNPHGLTLSDINAMSTTGSNSNIDKLIFNKDTVVVPSSEGEIGWNATDKTLNIVTGEGPILQIGQEQYVRVLNISGAKLFNGQTVYIDTASSERPTVKLANSKSALMARKTIGVLTMDIENNATGFVTTFGAVRGINTSAYTLGDTVYVGQTDGTLTKTEPTGDLWIVNVGVITRVHSTDGIIFVRTVTYEQPKALTEKTGFPQANPKPTTIGFVDSTRIFTISPTDGISFVFYQLSVQYRKNTAESIEIVDTEGLHYIYYNLGVLSDLINPTNAQIQDAIKNKTIISIVYWDATNKKGILIGDERHGHDMSGSTHAYLHFTRGAKWISGMALNTINATGNGSLNSHAQFGVDEGVGADEDLPSFPSAVLSTAGLPIFYIEGANAFLRRTILAGYPVLTDVAAGIGSTGRLVYNKLTTGVWSLAVLADDDFVLCHVLATNDAAQPYIAFIGQNTYATNTTARTGALSEMGSILSYFPKQELIPIATVIYESRNSYTNAVKARVIGVSTGVSYVDWRTSEIKASSGVTPTDHNSLSGIQGGTAGARFHLESDAGAFNALYTQGSDTFPLGQLTYTVTNAFITALTDVNINPDPTNKIGVWSVESFAGYFTITTDIVETSNISFDWSGVRN